MYTLTVSPEPNAIRDALQSLPCEGMAKIHLMPGIYQEKVVIDRDNTILEGSGADQTRILWNDGARTILADGKKRGTFRTATLRTDAKNVSLRSLSIENAASPRETVGQAIALYADGDGFTAQDCCFTSSQDTLFAAPLPEKEIEPGGFIGPKQFAPRLPQKHLYQRCKITGDIDFIFGGAAAWFEDCDIISRDGRKDRTEPFVGYCCAPSTPVGQSFGFVFHNCRFVNDNCPKQSVFLARPWREDAKAVFLHCDLGEHIAEEGFDDWNKPAAYKRSFFSRYHCTGPHAAVRNQALEKTLSDAQAKDMDLEHFCHSF